MVRLVQVDILHPLASLEWKWCKAPLVDIGGAQAVWLEGKVYVGGGTTFGNRRDAARLYIYTPATDTWAILDTPVYRFALTTYHSRLVLVGGREYAGGSPTDKLWTLSEHRQWQETPSLPPMPTQMPVASAVSHGDHLLVIDVNNNVYIYDGDHWESAEHPPHQLYYISSTVFNDHWHILGQRVLSSRGNEVYSASLDSLVASSQPSETSEPSSVWKRINNLPNEICYSAVFGNRLIAIGDGSPYTTTSLYAYSSFTQSWVHICDAQFTSGGAALCAIALPSNELMVVRGQMAFKVIIKSEYR